MSTDSMIFLGFGLVAGLFLGIFFTALAFLSFYGDDK